MTSGLWILLAIFAAVITVGVCLWWWPGYRRRQVMQKPLPSDWVDILVRNLPIYSRLSEQQRLRLHQLVQYFLHKKQFIGAGGLEINDEIRVTIAAEACLLILHQPSSIYGKLRFIYVYPYAYQAPHIEVGAGGVVREGKQARSGESWDNGKVVLSWNDVVHGTQDFTDGHNVVLHEFAHQLDQESGNANGAPLLKDSGGYHRWAKILADEFTELQRDAAHGHRSLMRYYGATNPAEFFAVATEHFFEQPNAMRRLHPALFQELEGYYGVDPQQWQ